MTVSDRERALEREVTRLAKHLGEAQDEAALMGRAAVRHADEAAAACERREGALGALRRYGWHDGTCPAVLVDEPGPCDCGWDRVEATLIAIRP